MHPHFLRLRDLRDPDFMRSKLSYKGRRSRRLYTILTFPLWEDSASRDQESASSNNPYSALQVVRFFFFSSADFFYPHGRGPGGWQLQKSAYDVATREGDFKNPRRSSRQLQIGTCQGHLPSASSRDWTLCCCSCDLRHTLKGAQRGEWDMLLQENWWNRSLDS